MKTVGMTTDGHRVVAGVFKLYDTAGLPLDVLFSELREHDILPSWLHFCRDALNAGWKPKTIVSRLQDSLADAYSPRFRDGVLATIRPLLEA
jgi:hypothetical protein